MSRWYTDNTFCNDNVWNKYTFQNYTCIYRHFMMPYYVSVSRQFKWLLINAIHIPGFYCFLKKYNENVIVYNKKDLDRKTQIISLILALYTLEADQLSEWTLAKTRLHELHRWSIFIDDPSVCLRNLYAKRLPDELSFPWQVRREIWFISGINHASEE